jgi:hypothetical protein
MPSVRHRPSSQTVPDFSAGPAAVVLHRHQVFTLLLASIILLLLLSLAGQIAKYKLGFPTGLGLIGFFYVDDENNLPSWYQSIAYLFAALLLALIALPLWHRGATYARHWALLAAIFAFLSLDEVGSLHERTIEPLQRLIGIPSGAWAPTWVVLGLAFVALLALLYLRFFFHLSWRERGQVLLAAALLVGGAIGVEMANSAVDLGPEIQRKQTLQYALMAHIEEGFEMLGLLVFIDFLLARLSRAPMMRVGIAN